MRLSQTLLPLLLLPLALLLLAGCALTPDAARERLAPTGVLRVAVPTGQPALASRDAGSGMLQGVSVDVAREAARRLQVPLALITFTTANQMADALDAGHVDLALVPADAPPRDKQQTTPPFLVLEGAVAVPAASPWRRLAELDRPGARVAVTAGSPYAQHLARQWRAATLVPLDPGVPLAGAMQVQRLDAAAGPVQALRDELRARPALRLLDERFVVLQQGFALPAGDAQALAWLSTLVAELRASGFVEAALARHGR